ncbi:MAG: hypothetical protein Q8S54_08075 [Bacteroidota bacterium]|nr:hypothetical protein [Bacteroidota bacterium]
MLLFIGGISVYLFAIHGFMRWPFVNIINLNQNKFWIAPFMLLLFLTLSLSSAWIFTKTEGFWHKKLSELKRNFSKVAFTISLIILPAILLVWGYNWHFQQLALQNPINLLNNLDESYDTSRKDIKFHKTETGEKVVWLRTGLNMSNIERFNLPPETHQDITQVHISSQVLYDSIPGECWLMAESFLGEIRLTRNSVKLNTTQTEPNHWQLLELIIDLQSPLVIRKELFQFYFYAKTNGNVYIDQIQVKLE